MLMIWPSLIAADGTRRPFTNIPLRLLLSVATQWPAPKPGDPTVPIVAFDDQGTRGATEDVSRVVQTDPEWRSDYSQTRPKVERKIAHLMRRAHGGRRARVRGSTKVAADFSLLAAAVNLGRLAVLGLTQGAGGWALSTS